MSDISRLIKLAKSALSEGLDPEEQILRVTAYCEAFDVWSAAFDPDARPLKTGDLLSLQESHREVMDLAEALSRQTAAQLKRFRQRARKVLSYDKFTDKKSSIRKVKKG